MIVSITKKLFLLFVLSISFISVAQAQNAKQPRINKFTPNAGPPGQEVKIAGVNFGNNSKVVEVRLGGVPMEIVKVKNNEIRAKVTGQNRTGVIQLAVSGVRSDPTSETFEVYPPVKATKMDPMTVSPGGEVKIYGSGFSSNPSDHILTIGNHKTVASRMEGSVAVFVVPSKVSPGPNAVVFEVKRRGIINIPVPLTISDGAAITSFAPMQGEPGTVVTIYGKGFGSSSSDVRVTVGGQYAQVNSVSPTAIVITVPAISSPSPITVQTKRGGTLVSSQSFAVSVQVVISTFAPMAGQPNQQVRLYGQGFDPNPRRNRVTLGNKMVQVLEAAPNTLVVKIPANASSDTFRITVEGGGSAESATAFQVAEPLVVTGFSPDNGSTGAFVKVTGKGFTTSGMRAFIGQTPVGLRVLSPTQALIGVPSKAKDGPIVMMSPAGVKASSKTSFRIIADVSVNKFYPLSGRPGTKVTLYGDQFEVGKTKIYLGKAELKLEPGMNSTMMVATVPNEAESGPFRVAVAGRREVRSVGAFKVLPPVETFTPKPTEPKPSTLDIKPDDKPVIEKLMSETPTEAIPKKAETGKAPTIDELLGFESDGTDTTGIVSFDPGEGPVGETVMINGSGFGDDPKKVTAWIGDKKATVVGCVPDMIMIEVPSGAVTGKIKIKVGAKEPMVSKTNFVVQ